MQCTKYITEMAAKSVTKTNLRHEVKRVSRHHYFMEICLYTVLPGNSLKDFYTCAGIIIVVDFDFSISTFIPSKIYPLRFKYCARIVII